MEKVHRVFKFNQNAWQKPHIYMNTGLRKKAKNNSEGFFWSSWIMQFWEKPWKMLENTEILNLSQQKEEETIWCQNQIIILQSFSQKRILAIEMKKNRDTYK